MPVSKHHNKLKKHNPTVSKEYIRARMEKELNSAYSSGIDYGVIFTKLLTYHILSDKFDFNNDQLQSFREYIEYISDSIIKKRLNFDDILDVLENESGHYFSTEDICMIDPTFSAYVSDDNVRKENHYDKTISDLQNEPDIDEDTKENEEDI